VNQIFFGLQCILGDLFNFQYGTVQTTVERYPLCIGELDAQRPQGNGGNLTSIGDILAMR
jgi:hypothetical protein